MTKTRNPVIDGLRGIAILSVLLGHLKTSQGTALLRAGWAGVDLFFVLSGFLVSGLLFIEWKREGELNVWRFLIRRGFKIYPAYFVFLFIALLLTRFGYTYGHLQYKSILGQALFIMNYIRPVYEHTWSLAVEEHFYLVIPFAIAFILTTGKKFLNYVVLICALILGLRCWNYLSRSEITFFNSVYPTHLRFDSLLVGVALGYLYHLYSDSFSNLFTRKRTLKLLITGCILAYALTINRYSFAAMVYGFNFLALGFAYLLGLAVSEKNTLYTRALSFSPLVWVGRISYSTYLWHMVAFSLFGRLAGNHPILNSPLIFNAGCIGLALILGYLSFRLVEEPGLELREILFSDKNSSQKIVNAASLAPNKSS